MDGGLVYNYNGGVNLNVPFCPIKQAIVVVMITIPRIVIHMGDYMTG